MIEIMCSVFLGMNFGNDIPSMYKSSMSKPRKLGQFYMILRSDAFVEKNNFIKNINKMCNAVKKQKNKKNEKIYLPNDKEIITSKLKDMSFSDIVSINEGSVIASTSNNESLKYDDIITLKFFDSTWIQLRNKEDQIVFSKLMSSNDEYSYSIVDNFTLTTGNAGNIVVLINGKTRGKVGKKGEVIDSFAINSDFNN